MAERDAQQARRAKKGKRERHVVVIDPVFSSEEEEEDGNGDAVDDEDADEPLRPPFSARKLAYYKDKFGVDQAEATNLIVRQVVRDYKEGLEWYVFILKIRTQIHTLPFRDPRRCLRYYYQGVPSWTWFYPFHYAPMASDLKDLAALETHFNYGDPFPPFMQLMSCLPSASAHCLPKSYQNLMIDSTSPIKDFYPETWAVDENDKPNPWMFVNLLPFIDEIRLRMAVAEVCIISHLGLRK